MRAISPYGLHRPSWIKNHGQNTWMPNSLHRSPCFGAMWNSGKSLNFEARLLSGQTDEVMHQTNLKNFSGWKQSFISHYDSWLSYIGWGLCSMASSLPRPRAVSTWNTAPHHGGGGESTWQFMYQHLKLPHRRDTLHFCSRFTVLKKSHASTHSQRSGKRNHKDQRNVHVSWEENWKYLMGNTNDDHTSWVSIGP